MLIGHFATSLSLYGLNPILESFPQYGIFYFDVWFCISYGMANWQYGIMRYPIVIEFSLQDLC